MTDRWRMAMDLGKMTGDIVIATGELPRALAAPLAPGGPGLNLNAMSESEVEELWRAVRAERHPEENAPPI